MPRICKACGCNAPKDATHCPSCDVDLADPNDLVKPDSWLGLNRLAPLSPFLLIGLAIVLFSISGNLSRQADYLTADGRSAGEAQSSRQFEEAMENISPEFAKTLRTDRESRERRQQTYEGFGIVALLAGVGIFLLKLVKKA